MDRSEAKPEGQRKKRTQRRKHPKQNTRQYLKAKPNQRDTIVRSRRCSFLEELPYRLPPLVPFSRCRTACGLPCLFHCGSDRIGSDRRIDEYNNQTKEKNHNHTPSVYHRSYTRASSVGFRFASPLPPPPLRLPSSAAISLSE